MASIPVERQIVDQLSELDEAQKQRVLAFVNALHQGIGYSARDLLKLPQEEREQMVAAAFEAAADEEFETF
jgi:hypothetical protein